MNSMIHSKKMKVKIKNLIFEKVKKHPQNEKLYNNFTKFRICKPKLQHYETLILPIGLMDAREIVGQLED